MVTYAAFTKPIELLKPPGQNDKEEGTKLDLDQERINELDKLAEQRVRDLRDGTYENVFKEQK